MTDIIVGVFNGGNGEAIPLTFYGVILQDGNDGKFLIPRGGNFLENDYVTHAYNVLTPFLQATFTPNIGMEQPSPYQVPTPYGRVCKWFADHTYNVVGYGFLKVGTTIEIPLFDTKEEAEKSLKPITTTPPITPEIPITTIPPVIETPVENVDQYVKIQSYITDPLQRSLYFEKYKSMIKKDFGKEGVVKLDFPSNTISYGKRFEQGTLISSTVSLYDEWGNLLIQTSGEGVLEGHNPFGNNHGCYYMIPEGIYKVVISNDGNNGKGDESWILAECYRQDELSNSGYFDYGFPLKINKGQSVEFTFNTHGVKEKPSGLIKINNVSR